MVITVYESVWYLSKIIIIKNAGPYSWVSGVYLKQQFSNLSGITITWRACEPQLTTPSVCPSYPQCLIHRSGLGWRICIFNNFSGDADAAYPGTTLEKHWFEVITVSWQFSLNDPIWKCSYLASLKKNVLLCPLEKQFMTYRGETILFVLYMLFYYFNSRSRNHFFKNLSFCPGQVAQLVGTSSHTPKGCRFDSWSGHIPR